MVNPSITYRSLLVACDFSEHSKIAYARAIEIASAYQCPLWLVHCVADLSLMPSVSETGLPFNDYTIMQKELVQESSVNLSRFIDENSSPTANAAVHPKVLVGQPHVELSEFANREKIDLVVTGRSGHSGWEQFFLGSISRGLITRCPCSVMAVGDQLQQMPRTILAATDFSEASRVSVLEGISLAKKLGAAIHLIHVIDDQDVPQSSISAMKGAEAMRISIQEHAKLRLERFIATLECDGLTLLTHMSTGIPWQDVCQTAKNLQADLIVMGNVGRHGLSGLVLGNTADRVLSHTKIRVLAVKHSSDVVVTT